MKQIKEENKLFRQLNNYIKLGKRVGTNSGISVSKVL